MRRFTALLFVCSLFLSGCLEYTERIVIGRDGSATIHLRLKVAGPLQAMIAKSPAFKSLAAMMNADLMAKNLPQGLVLRNHQQIPAPGRTTYINELYARDARAIQTGTSALFSGQQLGIEALPDGTLHYVRKLDFTETARDPELAGMIAENKLGIVGILKGAPFTFQVETPLTVLGTNGVTEGNVVSWNYMLYDLLQAPVDQDLKLEAPGLLDKVAGAATMLFQPRAFPFFAAFLLGVFFIVTLRRREPQEVAG